MVTGDAYGLNQNELNIQDNKFGEFDLDGCEAQSLMEQDEITELLYGQRYVERNKHRYSPVLSADCFDRLDDRCKRPLHSGIEDIRGGDSFDSYYRDYCKLCDEGYFD